MSLFFFWRAVCFFAIMQKFCAIALSYWLPVLAIRAKATMRNIFNSKKFIKTYRMVTRTIIKYTIIYFCWTHTRTLAALQVFLTSSIISSTMMAIFPFTSPTTYNGGRSCSVIHYIYLYTIVFSNFVDPISEYGSGSAPFQIGKKGWNDVQIRTFLTCYYLLVFKKDFVNV